jgi:hypothetical protein
MTAKLIIHAMQLDWTRSRRRTMRGNLAVGRAEEFRRIEEIRPPALLAICAGGLFSL